MDVFEALSIWYGIQGIFTIWNWITAKIPWMRHQSLNSVIFQQKKSAVATIGAFTTVLMFKCLKCNESFWFLTLDTHASNTLNIFDSDNLTIYYLIHFNLSFKYEKKIWFQCKTNRIKIHSVQLKWLSFRFSNFVFFFTESLNTTNEKLSKRNLLT